METHDRGYRGVRSSERANYAVQDLAGRVSAPRVFSPLLQGLQHSSQGFSVMRPIFWWITPSVNYILFIYETTES